MLLTNKIYSAILQVQSENGLQNKREISSGNQSATYGTQQGGSNIMTIYDELNYIDDNAVAITPTAYEILGCGR